MYTFFKTKSISFTFTISFCFLLSPISLSSNFFEEIDFTSTSLSQTNLLASIQEISCHRSWITNVSKFLSEMNETPHISLVQPSRYQSVMLYRECRRLQATWSFCFFQRSPYSLHWTYFSAVICKHLPSSMKFRVVFDKQIFERKVRRYIKNVKVRHDNIDQKIIQAARITSRKRDLYFQNNSYVVIGILLNTIGDHLNASVIAENMENIWKSYQNSSLDEDEDDPLNATSPTIHPRIFARTLTTLDRFALIESTRYTRIDSVDFNFVYCDTPKLQRSKMWDLTIIFQAFNIDVWILLFVTLLICSVIISETCFVNHISSAVFTLFTSLLGGNIYFGLKNTRKSILFILWMMVSIVINNYYTGSMTSILITPLDESVMTNLRDLDANNYSLVFPSNERSMLNLVNASAVGEESRWGRRNQSRNHYNQSSEIKMLRKMLGENSTDLSLSPKKFEKAVAVGVRKAAFGPWIYCMTVYNWAMSYIERRNEKLSSVKRSSRHCHIGKRLVPSGGFFWGFLPPENEAPATVFRKLLESGIYYYWMEDYTGIGFAPKVQERLQVKSPTEIIPPENLEVKWAPMDLTDGHTMTIVFVWFLGISLSLFMLVLEVCRKKLSMALATRDREQSEMSTVFIYVQ